MKFSEILRRLKTMKRNAETNHGPHGSCGPNNVEALKLAIAIVDTAATDALLPPPPQVTTSQVASTPITLAEIANDMKLSPEIEAEMKKPFFSKDRLEKMFSMDPYPHGMGDVTEEQRQARLARAARIEKAAQNLNDFIYRNGCYRGYDNMAGIAGWASNLSDALKSK